MNMCHGKPEQGLVFADVWLWSLTFSQVWRLRLCAAVGL